LKYDRTDAIVFLSYWFVHKFVHHRDTLPDIFHNYFTLNSSVHNYATRQKDELHLFNILNTTHGQRSIRHKGCIMEWSPSHTATEYVSW